MSRRELQRLLAEGVLERVNRGVVVGSCVRRIARNDRVAAHRLALHALLLCFDDCVASHESAAVLFGLPLLGLPQYVVATRARGAWRGGPNARVRIAPLPPHHVVRTEADTRMTSMARTFVDVARTSAFRAAVVLGDGVLRTGLRTDGLEETLGECSSWADVGKARNALRFLDSRAESPLESASRAVMHERKLPAPELQVAIDTGPASYRVDFFWRRHGLIGEADGMAKYDDIATVRAEKLRQERLEQLGLRVVRWTWREMLADTDTTIARLRAALR
ncbi:MAG TPA: DUF559 domain-containing protein [Mycobacteriales bacterium]|nr:DUF559 domain-containing protein [Mycobacteriales bacterium]